MENWIDPDFKKTIEKLQKNYKVATMLHHNSEVFINLFRQHWWNGLRWFDKKNGISRSNWTYNVANGFLNTCRDMNFKCNFEIEGRHDGVIVDEFGTSILYAEWEWEHLTVFSEKGEFNKLVKSVEENKTANALLFTYVPKEEYESYLGQIIEKWTNSTDAILYFFTPVLINTEDGNEIVTLRVVDIQKDGIIFWNDN